jgi:hypothetical protein
MRSLQWGFPVGDDAANLIKSRTARAIKAPPPIPRILQVLFTFDPLKQRSGRLPEVLGAPSVKAVFLRLAQLTLSAL